MDEASHTSDEADVRIDIVRAGLNEKIRSDNTSRVTSNVNERANHICAPVFSFQTCVWLVPFLVILSEFFVRVIVVERGIRNITVLLTAWTLVEVSLEYMKNVVDESPSISEKTMRMYRKTCGTMDGPMFYAGILTATITFRAISWIVLAFNRSLFLIFIYAIDVWFIYLRVRHVLQTKLKTSIRKIAFGEYN